MLFLYIKFQYPNVTLCVFLSVISAGEKKHKRQDFFTVFFYWLYHLTDRKDSLRVALKKYRKFESGLAQSVFDKAVRHFLASFFCKRLAYSFYAGLISILWFVLPIWKVKFCHFISVEISLTTLFLSNKKLILIGKIL